MQAGGGSGDWKRCADDCRQHDKVKFLESFLEKFLQVEDHIFYKRSIEKRLSSAPPPQMIASQKVFVIPICISNSVQKVFHLSLAKHAYISSKMATPWPFFMSSPACCVWFHNAYCLWKHGTDIRLELIAVTDNQDEGGATGVRIPAACRWGLNQFRTLARSLAYWTHRLTLLKMAVTSKPNSDLWHVTICWLPEMEKSENKALQCSFWQENWICADKGIK